MTDIDQAVQILRRGGLVAFPTETVYGLGADATNEQAIKKIFRAKGRPSTNPLIVHIADIPTAKKFAATWPDSAQLLAEKFWPGPLTLILPKSPAIVDPVTAGRNTVGLRVPNHPLALALLSKFNGPLAAPSANRSTRVSPTTAQHVRDELGEAVDIILDGGPCTVGIESTVLDLTTTPATILRPGAVSKQHIEELIGSVQLFTGQIDPSVAGSSPGQHAVHYSPRATTYRFETDDLPRIRKGKDGVILTIAPQHGDLQMPANPSDYARILYSTLREMDARNVKTIFIQMPPDQPQWLAIRDRLIRATRLLPPDLG
ncbi:MAG TPA: L-threonylcarbamoyladenylate synthase [Tepidisphaeraceae bacterium]|nr:L-threonylcarbamoyladenylate synthase [Tepidisphaeraceae bacterium]